MTAIDVTTPATAEGSPLETGKGQALPPTRRRRSAPRVTKEAPAPVPHASTPAVVEPAVVTPAETAAPVPPVPVPAALPKPAVARMAKKLSSRLNRDGAPSAGPTGTPPIRTRRRRSAAASAQGAAATRVPTTASDAATPGPSSAVATLGSALPAAWALDSADTLWQPRSPWRLGYTATLWALAALFWAGLVGVIYAVNPELPAGRTGFFVLLGGALFCTLAPLLRLIALRFSHSRVFQEAVSWHAARQAALLTVFVLLNALLQLERAWSGLAALLLFCVFAVFEIVAQARR